MGLTIDQMNLAMVITSKVSSSLSLGGSTLIVRDVVKKWRKKKDNEHLPTTTWLVLSMSIADIGTSFFVHFIGS